MQKDRNIKHWNEKRYFSLDYYLKQLFHDKIYKISLNAGMTCPNRDGTIGTGGCIFCSEGGSGDFAQQPCLSITEQIEHGKSLVAKKSKSNRYIAYFQAFTNTYAPVSYLRKVYFEALSHPDIVGISIATRPDCLPDDVIMLLSECNQIKPVFIELGLQTCHNNTANLIRRGYPLSVYESAVQKLREHNLPVIVHIILGLPYETMDDILTTIQYLNTSPIQGVKLQLLHVLKHTDLEVLYRTDPTAFAMMDFTTYVNTVIACIELLRDDIVIHRITGDGPKELLLAPIWSLNKRLVLNTINQQLVLTNTWQGKYFNHMKGESQCSLNH